jgi:hypothetical protein
LRTGESTEVGRNLSTMARDYGRTSGQRHHCDQDHH